MPFIPFMKFLIVAATIFEIQPLLNHLQKKEEKGGLQLFSYSFTDIDILITGIGMVATTYRLSKLSLSSYDLVINAGVAGAFTREISIGTVVNVQSEVFAEVGAEDGDGFLDLQQMGLGLEECFNHKGELINPTNVSLTGLKQLPLVKGVTVNTVHGNEKSISELINRLSPDIESMEGGAFFYVCINERVPFVELRAISNYVERRNKANWDLKLAIDNLNTVLLELIRNT